MINSICVENGRIFIEGKETIDPLLIGYAIIDAIENGFEVKVSKETFQRFDTKEIVYLIHDIEQLPRMITSINVTEENVMYEVISGTQVSTHFSFELSKTKTVY